MVDSNSLLGSRVARSKEAWRRLGRQILSITPSQLARMFLALGALAVAVWIVTASWPALAPFIIGGVVVYAVLPLVNVLDRLMPRFLASFIGVAVALALLFGVVAVIIPPLLRELLRLIRDLPDANEVQAIVGGLGAQATFQRLPETVQRQLLEGLTVTLLRGRNYADNIVPSLFGGTPILNLANTVASVLGLLVLPTWALVLLKDQPRAWPSAAKALPVAIRADVAAMLRIVDGAFGSFLRSQILLGVAVGVATYAGLGVLESYAGLTVGNYKLVLAVLSGFLQLIPGVGPWVNIVGTVVLAYTVRSTAAALQVLALYAAIQLVVVRFISNRSGPQLLDVHPGILVLVIVALSQLGIVWAFLAAPIAAAARDLWRYLYGRASEPPLPAGLLPSQRESYAKQVAAQQANAARPLPAAYRRR